MRDLTLRSLRAAIGLVLDEPFLFSASVRDNIAYGRPDAADDEVEAAARAARADGLHRGAARGYDTGSASAATRSRAASASASPSPARCWPTRAILVLDDATSAIDVHVEEEIHARSACYGGRTTLVIAHRLSTIHLADRVVLLEEGRIVADGTHAQLMRTEPRYAEVLAHIEEDELPASRARGRPARVPRAPAGRSGEGGQDEPNRRASGASAERSYDGLGRGGIWGPGSVAARRRRAAGLPVRGDPARAAGAR